MKTCVFSLLVLLLLSCNESSPRIGVVEEKDLSQTQMDSILEDYNFVYDNIAIIDSTDYIILPIATQRNRGGSKDGSRYSSYDTTDYPNYWNLLFHNTSTNKANLLTEEKVNIVEFNYNLFYESPILQNKILYKIQDKDYNLDGHFNYKDPTLLFISEVDGTALTRLSPLDENLQDYTIIPKTNKIILKTQRDVNKDLIFDKKDEVIWYQLDLANSNILVEIIKPEQRKLIENLYFKQWLVKDKSQKK